MFGSGQAMGAVGLFAYSPLGDDLDVDAMLPMIVGNRHVKDLRVAAAGAGATAVPDVLDFAARGRLLGQNAQAAVTAVAAAGDAGSRLTGVVCPDGAPSKVDNCTLPIDPRGAGVSRAIGMEIGDPKAKIRF